MPDEKAAFFKKLSLGSLPHNTMKAPYNTSPPYNATEASWSALKKELN